MREPETRYYRGDHVLGHNSAERERERKREKEREGGGGRRTKGEGETEEELTQRKSSYEEKDMEGKKNKNVITEKDIHI